MDREDLRVSSLVKVHSFLVRHPEVRDWGGVDWCQKLASVPLAARVVFEREFRVRCTTVESRSDSRDGSTTKLAVRGRSGQLTETVVIRHSTVRSKRVTVCVSSQIGCAMACAFCATGTMGFLGDLSCAEILEQVLEAKAIDGRLTNVVFMGMGEPLNNYDNVLEACRLLLDDKVFAMGASKVTISTVGVASKIRKLANDEPRVNLALSLHAPTQQKRETIMPAAKQYPLQKSLLSALDFYVQTKLRTTTAKNSRKKKRPLLMIEYILLRGVNDSIEDAETLGHLIRNSAFGTAAMVNLIAYNTVAGLPFQRPDDDVVRRFQTKLQQAGDVLTCVRITMGDDVSGACGQLVKEITHQKKSQDIEELGLGPLSPPPPQRQQSTKTKEPNIDPERPAKKNTKEDSSSSSIRRRRHRSSLAIVVAAAACLLVFKALRLRRPPLR